MTIARNLVAAAAAVASLCAGPTRAAPADPVVAEAIHALEAICARHAGRQIDVVAAADADGYLPAGPEIVTGMLRGGDFNSVARIKRIGKAIVYLIVPTAMAAGKEAPAPGTTMDSCVVGVRGANPALAQAGRDWVGVPGEDGRYPFIEALTGRKGSDVEMSDEEGAAALREGRVRMLQIEAGKDATYLVYVGMRQRGDAVTSAEPEGPFADFLKICVKDDGASALALAEADHWMPAPPTKGSDFPWPMVSGELMLKSTEDDFKVLMVGRAETQLALKMLEMKAYCGIAQAPPNDAALIKSAEDWLAVSPIEVDPQGNHIYLFSLRNGVHESLGEKWEKVLAARMKAGPVYFVLLKRSQMGDPAYASIGRISKASNF